MLYASLYNSPLGRILIHADATGLCGLWFHDQKGAPQESVSAGLAAEHPVLVQTVHWLNLYFDGGHPSFTPPLHLTGSPFRRLVQEQMLRIPYGSTITYGELARRVAAQLGRSTMSAQAVGGAVGRNEISIIIPCHRVVGAKGALTGYAGGLERKQYLLSLERQCLGLPMA